MIKLLWAVIAVAMALSGCVTSPHVQYASYIDQPSFQLSNYRQVSLDLKSDDLTLETQITESLTQYFTNKGLSIVDSADLSFKLRCEKGHVAERINESRFETRVVNLTPSQSVMPSMSAMNQAQSHECRGIVMDKSKIVWRINVNLPNDYRKQLGTEQMHFIAGLFKHGGKGVLSLNDGQMY